MHGNSSHTAAFCFVGCAYYAVRGHFGLRVKPGGIDIPFHYAPHLPNTRPPQLASGLHATGPVMQNEARAAPGKGG